MGGHTVFANRGISGHVVFTNRGINVQTETNQDQGCEGAGGTSGTTNSCTTTSWRGSSQTSIETSVTLTFEGCAFGGGLPGFECSGPISPCNNIGCGAIFCRGPDGDCTTDNGVQLTSCTNTIQNPILITCTLTKTHTVPGTGITQSGGITGG
jgi:hypothetical protein